MTARLIRACENPYVNIIGHPTGRRFAPIAGIRVRLRRSLCGGRTDGNGARDRRPSRAPRSSGGACAQGEEFGVTFSLDSDAHRTGDLAATQFAIGQARSGRPRSRATFSTLHPWKRFVLRSAQAAGCVIESLAMRRARWRRYRCARNAAENGRAGGTTLYSFTASARRPRFGTRSWRDSGTTRLRCNRTARQRRTARSRPRAHYPRRDLPMTS